MSAPAAAEKRKLTMVEAARLALAEEMRRDPTVWCLGEDLGRGGVFQQYKGLQAEFGPARVLDTPISEAAIMGAAVGAAMCGTRPVVETRYLDFTLCAADELVNQAAKARYMFGGQARVPLVVRQPTGLWMNCAAQHSQSLEAWWAHMPGLVVLAPATPADSYAMLKAAIRCDDPVILLEHKELWGVQGDVAISEAPDAQLGKARLCRAGRDVTIVAWSATVATCLDAAEALAREGIDAEVIDLRCIWPWDEAGVVASAAKTGRLLVVHEAVQAAGFGAEIAATVAEATGARVKRLGSPRIPVPFSPALEAAFRRTADEVAAAARAMLRANAPALTD
jgi:pyruvate/2-oxoglutarate/acetoin dehydrogenase E1 component